MGYEMRGLRFERQTHARQGRGALRVATQTSIHGRVATGALLVDSPFSYGGLSQPSLYPELRKLADGYPDESGRMTAISSALTISMVQVFIQHEAEAMLTKR